MIHKPDEKQAEPKKEKEAAAQQLPPPIDFRQLFELQSQHEEFKRKSKVNRFLFTVLCGAWFHLLFHSFGITGCTWESFFVIDLLFIGLLSMNEKINFTRPINVRQHFLVI